MELLCCTTEINNTVNQQYFNKLKKKKKNRSESKLTSEKNPRLFFLPFKYYDWC